MHQAIELARSGAASANKAAEMYGIPKLTLKDRVAMSNLEAALVHALT